MITVEFITALFYEVDEQLRTIPKHPEAHLWPSEVVTLGLLHALKGVGNRPFYRWLTRAGANPIRIAGTLHDGTTTWQYIDQTGLVQHTPMPASRSAVEA